MTLNNLILSGPVGWDCEIHRLHRSKTLINKCPGYDPKPSVGETPHLELWKMSSTFSLRLLIGQLWPEVAAPTGSYQWVKQFDHLNCVQTNDIEFSHHFSLYIYIAVTHFKKSAQNRLVSDVLGVLTSFGSSNIILALPSDPTETFVPAGDPAVKICPACKITQFTPQKKNIF